MDFTATKRYSNRWQMQAAADAADQPAVLPGRIGDVHQPDRPGVPGWLQHYREVQRESSAAATPCRGTSAPRRTSTRYRARVAPSTINGPGAIYGGVNAAGRGDHDQHEHAGARAESETRFKPVNLLDLGLQKALEVRDEVSDQTDTGCLQHHEHQHHHRLLERQQEPGRLHPADHDHRATCLPLRHANSVLRRLLDLARPGASGPVRATVSLV